MTQPTDETPPKDDEPVAHPLNDNPWLKKFQALGEGLESGRITQAEFERRHRALMIELQHQADKDRKKIKNWAINVTKKLRDEAEYKRLCAHYHDEYGDSFHHFLTSIYAGATFVTMNDKLLDDARLLELRFGGKIMTPQQAAEASEKEAHQKEMDEKAAAEGEGAGTTAGSP